MPRRAALTLVVAVVALLGVVAGAAGQEAPPPWRSADQMREALDAAGTDLILDDGAGAEASVAAAAQAYRGPLRAGVRASGAAIDARVRDGLDRAREAAADGDAAALAAARESVWGALTQASFVRAVTAARAGDVAEAGAWLKLRDFRTATRAYRPRPEATLALTDLAAGDTDAATAALLIRKDLLDAYQSRMDELLDEARAAAESGFPTRMAETTALAAAYWRILRPEYREQRGAAALATADARIAAVATAGAAADEPGLTAALNRATATIGTFTAAPLTPEETARRANQLTRFLDLVPFEYGKGVSDGRVTIPFEIQEARTFLDAASDALGDLTPALDAVDPAAAPAAAAAVATLDDAISRAEAGETGLPSDGDVERVAQDAITGLEAVYPTEWTEGSDEADFEIIQLTLDRMQSAVAAGEYDAAEQARIEAYALFEFGPERKLAAFDPQLTAQVEGRIWFGWDGAAGLATQIARKAPVGDVRGTRAELDKALRDAQITLGEGGSGATVVTNSALIVFREGLEAVLILAAVTASMIGASRGLRKPVLWGGIVALGASAVTFVLAQTLLRSLSAYGEKLEAVVGLVAIGVLLLILNWFFHKVYWTQHISHFHGKRRRLLSGTAEGGLISAQVIGLVMLGFTSVYREGFETVLFLQALQLSSGTAVVLEGVALGLAAVGAVAVATFALQRKLPYKKMLIVTGVLIGGVLLIMVGSTVRTLQGVGWLSITPIDIGIPYWAGEWFGVFPTWETMAAQAAALLFVVGSYLLAEHYRNISRRRARRTAQENRERSAAIAGEPPPPDATAPAATPSEGNAAARAGR